MNYYFGILLLAFITLAKIITCDNNKQDLAAKAVEISIDDPFMGYDFYRVFYLDDLRMYQSNYQFDSTVIQMHVDTSTNEISQNQNLALSEKRTRFFVFHKDSAWGYNYEPPPKTEDNRAHKVDSMINLITIGGNMDKFLV